MARHGSIAEQLAAVRTMPPKAANDNYKQAKAKPARYRGTLPALRWLFDNHPDLAPAVAAAMPKPQTLWAVDAEDGHQVIRPTVGELLKAAGDAFRVFVRDGIKQAASGITFEKIGKDIERASFGTLKFNNGKLVEWAVTKKGSKLRPVDRLCGAGEKKSSARNPGLYIRTKPTTPSPMHAEPLPRNMSGLPALPPMYDPQDGVEAARSVLRGFGVDGATPFDRLPAHAKRYETVIAKGAGFLGGVSRSSGNASSGAQAWEAPGEHKGEAATVIEEVAARGTLKSIGIRLGYSEEYADRAGKAALIEAAKVLTAANDNKSSERVPIRGSL